MPPSTLKIGLIPGDALCIVLDLDAPGDWHIAFDASVHPGADERSRLGAALLRHTSLRHVGEERQVFVGDCRVARLHGAQLIEHRRLTAFGARFLAENGLPLAEGPLQHDAVAGHNAAGPLQTDLHSHFAGCLSGHDLVQIGLLANAKIPHSVLAQAGVFCESDTPLGLLDPPARGRLACALDIPLDRQVTFLDMERIYAMRAPLTRCAALFEAQLWRIATQARDSGVTYLELSLSSILNPATLTRAHAALPVIEAQTGVGIRFLVALSRHDDLEWDLDVLRQVKACLGSRAIVGIDFMGHETNSTRAFLPQLKAAGELSRYRPGWVVRVHAGENPAFSENVREAIAALRPLVRDQGLELRIGHGLYGLEDDTLHDVAALSTWRRAEGGSVVFEFNLTSNLALNNIRTTFDVPLRRVLEAGVDVVLGTDGPGLYRTHVQDESQAARATGLSDSDIQTIAATEQRLLARKRAQQNLLPSWGDFAVPPSCAPLHYTEAVARAKQAQQVAAREALQARLRALSLPLYDAPNLRAHLAERPVLNLSGAWRNSYQQLGEDDIARLTVFFQGLLSGMAPLRGVVLTGGTRDGVEGLLHRCAQRIATPTAEVIALISAQVPLESLEAQGLNGLHVVSTTLYDKAAPLYALVQECRGLALFVGGGVIVSDEIQAARNLGLHYCLIDDLPGASAKACTQDRSHAVSLLEPELTARRVLEKLVAGPQHEQLFHPGANDAVDIVVLRYRGGDPEPEVLLVRRHDDAPAENGRFALPGGFRLAGETLSSAAVRELVEETGLVLAPSALSPVARFEGGGRDPRDTTERWVRSHLFLACIRHPGPSQATLVAGTDASRAFFVPLSRRPQCLAFDHEHLLAVARPQAAVPPEDSNFPPT